MSCSAPHVARIAQVMHRDDGPRSRRDLGLHVRRIQRVRLVDIGKHRHAVLQQRADDRPAGRPRRHDHFVPRLRIDRPDTHVHRRRSGRHRNRVLHPMARRKRPLERLDPRPLAHVPRPHHLRQRRNIVIPKHMPRPKRLRPDRRPTINRQPLPHPPPPAPSPRCPPIIPSPRAHCPEAGPGVHHVPEHLSTMCPVRALHHARHSDLWRRRWFFTLSKGRGRFGRLRPKSVRGLPRTPRPTPPAPLPIPSPGAAVLTLALCACADRGHHEHMFGHMVYTFSAERQDRNLPLTSERSPGLIRSPKPERVNLNS